MLSKAILNSNFHLINFKNFFYVIVFFSGLNCLIKLCIIYKTNVLWFLTKKKKRKLEIKNDLNNSYKYDKMDELKLCIRIKTYI